MTNITLGKSYPLRFDFNSISAFEELTGQSIMNVIATGNIGFSTVRTLLWASLAELIAESSENAVTPNSIGVLIQDEWIDKGKTFPELAGLISKALKESGLMSSGKKAGKSSGKSAQQPEN